MKRLIFIFLLFSFAAKGFSQCIPDTNCVDVDEPGQVCPDSLPAGQQGVYYDQIITIIAPDSANIGDLKIGLYKIQVDTVTNLPAGLSYFTDHTDFYPDSLYCIEISGTPSTSGTFYLRITVIPFMLFSGSPLALPAQTDSTSVFITIEEASSAIFPEENVFRLIPVAPNPFLNETRIGATVPGPGALHLRVFNVTGNLVYDIQKQAIKGKNFFSFGGEKFSSGIYFFHISFNDRTLTGKLVKTQ